MNHQQTYHPAPEVDLAGFAHALRTGATSAAKALEFYIRRIEKDEAEIGAFEHLAVEHARKTAAAVDAVIAAEGDLGPLMGLPVVVKDTFAVDGRIQCRCGRSHRSGRRLREAPAPGRLHRAGQSRTIEFALGGAGGANTRRGSPRKPRDPAIHRGCWQDPAVIAPAYVHLAMQDASGLTDQYVNAWEMSEALRSQGWVA